MKKRTLFLLAVGVLLSSCGNSYNVSSTSITNSTDSQVDISTNSESTNSVSTNIEYVDIVVYGGTASSTHVEKGSNVFIRANNANDGQTFSCWKNELGEIISREQTFMYTANNSITLTAVYEYNDVTINVTGGTGKGTYKYGTSVTVSAIEEDGKIFSAWVNEKDQIVSKSCDYTFDAISNMTLKAIFVDGFSKPKKIDDIRDNISSFTSASRKIKEIEYENIDYKYSSNYTEKSNIESVQLYSNGTYVEGNYKEGSKNDTYSRQYYLDGDKFYESQIFDSLKDNSSASCSTVGVDADKNAVYYTMTNYNLTEFLRLALTKDVFTDEDLFECNYLESGDYKIVAVGHSKDSTLYKKVSIEMICDTQYNISKLEILKQNYVISTQCDKDGNLKEDAVSKHEGYSKIKYVCTKNDEDRLTYPKDKDTRSSYFISSFDVKGRYYENGVNRYFDSTNNKIWLNADITPNYVEMIKETISPATYLENINIKVKESSNRNILRLITDDSGKVTSIKAIGVGKCNLTFVTSTGLEKTFEFEVCEKLPPVSFAINIEDSVEVNSMIQLNIKDLRPVSSDSEIIWSVEGDSGELVTEGNKTFLKGVKKGKVTVIAKSKMDSSIVATKEVVVSGGNMELNELKEYVIGTWSYNSNTQGNGYKFIFDSDGTFTCIDNYRSGNKINCKGKYTFINKTETDMIHKGTYVKTDAYIEGYRVIEITDIVLPEEDKAATYLAMHFAIAENGKDIVCHFQVSSTGNTLEVIATKDVA